MPSSRRAAGAWPRALAGRGIGRGDTVAVMAPNVPGDAGGALRRADGGRRPQRAQLPARRPHDRLHPRARRGQAADHRPRVLADHRAGAGPARSPPAGDRYRRPAVRGRAAPRRERLRGVSGRGRPGVRGAAARGGVAGHLPALHLGHDRRPQGRRLPSPRRLSQRPRQRAHVRALAAHRLSVDAADVPLQRLDLHVGGHRGGRHPRLPAPRRSRPRSSRPSRATA